MTDPFQSRDLRFYDILDALLADVNARLLNTLGGQAERVCVYPGLIAWDDCQCGQLAGAVTSIYPCETFPLPIGGRVGGDIFSCPPPYVVANLIVSLVRCAPQPIGNEMAPTCDALTTASRIWTVDAAVARRGVICTLDDMKKNDEIIEYRFDRQSPVGPEGACVGTDTAVTVGLDF